ncbi:MAG: hypothetical protein ACYDGM_11365, partial [Vulcanimicrobiaceae bacterium]
LLGVAGRAVPANSSFDLLGASLHMVVVRRGVTLPANRVPFLKPGDTIRVSFPKGVQMSTSPRWHLVVANMYNDYLQHPPTFPIADADLSAKPPGHVWSVVYHGQATPIFFLVPENGSWYGNGIPAARSAISNLSDRAALARAALFSASAAAKASTLQTFLRSLATIRPADLTDGRARIASATQSLFGYDLSSAPCFDPSVAQSTQTACAAQAIVSSYQMPTGANVTTALGSQLSVNAATYGMLIGALYQLLAKRRTEANYTFVPGAFKPNSTSTNVYVRERLQYDPSGTKPSTIVYFQIGSQGDTAAEPAFGAAPSMPVCLASTTFNAAIPFSGLPVYFRAHRVTFVAAHHTFVVPASYDPIAGYSATLTDAQRALLANGGTASIASEWGFDAFTSPPIQVVEPRAVLWTMEHASSTELIAGQNAGTLTFTDGTNAMGACTKSVTVRDGLGHMLAVSGIRRTRDTVAATVDAATAGAGNGDAVVTGADGVESAPIPITILPAMPSVTKAIAYLPEGLLVLSGTGLKYIDTVTLKNTGIVFANGSPQANGDWAFTATAPTAYQPIWEHETMSVLFTLQPPDVRTDAVEADVRYALPPT